MILCIIMKTPIRGINYQKQYRKYYVMKYGIYIGQYFTFEQAREALEEWIKWRDT